MKQERADAGFLRWEEPKKNKAKEQQGYSGKGKGGNSPGEGGARKGWPGFMYDTNPRGEMSASGAQGTEKGGAKGGCEDHAGAKAQ